MPSLAEQAQTIANLYQPPPTGRPSDLASQSTVQQFLEAVGEGNYIDTAAKLAGISKQVVYNWIKRGQADEPGNDAYKAFVDSLEKAEARAEADAIRNVRQAGKLPQYWAAEMTYLERRHPDKWGRRQEGESGPKVQVIIGGTTTQVQIAMVSPPTFAPLVPETIHANSLETQPFALPSSLITSIMVTEADACQAQAEADRQGQFAAGEPEGGPYPVGLGTASPRQAVGEMAGVKQKRLRGRAGQKKGPGRA